MASAAVCNDIVASNVLNYFNQLAATPEKIKDFGRTMSMANRHSYSSERNMIART
jgi:hypothetical protein